MSGVKEVFKSGWHPDKGTTLKKQVTGIFHRDDSDRHTSHNARPISELRDPASFGAPPKRYPTQPLPPPNVTPTSAASGAGLVQGHGADSTGVRTPVEPPRPFRVDTTGLSTSNLPPPPLRRPDAGGDALSPPPPYSPRAPTKPVPPRLPPRLPPRTGAGSPSAASQAVRSSPPIPSAPPMNKGAIDRLGAAGISVPGLGIGTSTSSPVVPPQQPSPGSAPSPAGGLQSRFAKLAMASPAAASPPPSEGTTLAQKQAALRTIADFRHDPSSVSPSEARSAASTANNFRQRHGDQVASGLKTAQGINQKYGVADRLAAVQHRDGGGPGIADRTTSDAKSPAVPASTLASAQAVAGLLGKKKPAPPPPPRKKPDLSAGSTDNSSRTSPASASSGGGDVPPPIPLTTRPTF